MDRAGASTKHFRIELIRASLSDVFGALVTMAKNWERYKIVRVEFCFAPFIRYYISVTAKAWYDVVADANDPDYQGDAQDVIEDHPVLAYNHRLLTRKPSGYALGRWHVCDTAEKLFDEVRARGWNC